MRTNTLAGLRGCTAFALAGLCLAIVPARGLAQATAPQQSIAEDAAAGTKTSATGAANPTNAEVLAELARMRARIAELEAQLKAQQSGTPTFVNASVNASPSVANPATVALNTAKPPQAADQASTQQKEAPAAPFAYADWTWLNGTPRNKDAVWDSKFFTPTTTGESSR